LRQRLRESLASTTAAHPIVVFGCDHGADVTRVKADGVRTFSLLCTGQLPPSFVEYALRDGAAGVVVAACRDGGCEFRFGERWTAERLRGEREPHLRASVDAERIELVFAGRNDEVLIQQAVDRLRSLMPPLGAVVSDPHHV
jgi:coenzyme F420-reducing hydrogenase delta subunit